MYVCDSLLENIMIFLMLMFMYMYFCIHVSMSLSTKVLKDHSYGGMITFVGEWHDVVPGLMGNQVERLVMTNIRVQYHVDIN